MNRYCIYAAIAAVSLACVGARANGAGKDDASHVSAKGPFPLKLERASKVGDRTESTGSWKMLDYARGATEGMSLGDIDKYIEARYDVIEKVTKVSDSGKPEAYRLYFQSLETRSDEGDKFEDASCVNVPIDVSVWPEQTIAREDGDEIPDDEMLILKRMYPQSNPAAPDDDTVLAVPKLVSVGDSWSPKPEVVGKMLQSDGIMMPDKAATALLKISGKREVHGVDCLVLDITITCPEIDGITTLPQDVKSIHGGFNGTQQILVPIDPDQQIMGDTVSESSKYNAVLDKDDQTVELIGRHTESHSYSFVKRM